jgi:hypothetical protein
LKRQAQQRQTAKKKLLGNNLPFIVGAQILGIIAVLATEYIRGKGAKKADEKKPAEIETEQEQRTQTPEEIKKLKADFVSARSEADKDPESEAARQRMFDYENKLKALNAEIPKRRRKKGKKQIGY